MLKFSLAASGVQAMKYPLVAKKAEDCGYNSFFMPEHLIMPVDVPNKYPYTPGYVPPINAKTQLYDPWVALAWVAGSTEKINLGTGIFILPLRHPIYTARQVATADMISRGRIILGVGAGWQPQEFEYVGLSFKDRGHRMEECIEVLRKLWTQPVIEHHGKYFNFGPATFEPKPARPGGPPILIAGNSEVVFRRCGQMGDGWYGHAPTFAENQEFVEKINSYRREFGREKLPFDFATSLKRDRPGPPTLDEAKRMEEIGITTLNITPWVAFQRKVTIDQMYAGIEDFANNVMAKMQ